MTFRQNFFRLLIGVMNLLIPIFFVSVEFRRKFDLGFYLVVVIKLEKTCGKREANFVLSAFLGIKLVLLIRPHYPFKKYFVTGVPH